MLKFVCVFCLLATISLFSCVSCHSTTTTTVESIPFGWIEAQALSAVDISKASVRIVTPDNFMGSGTIIRYNDQLYILTVYHLFDEMNKLTVNDPMNMVVAFDNYDRPILLTYVKHDPDLDICLFKVPKNCIGDYEGISRFGMPIVGLDVWTASVVAFPGYMADGIITARFDETHYCSNMSGELGSSGSGVFYKGTRIFTGMIQSKCQDYPGDMVFLSWRDIKKWLEE